METDPLSRLQIVKKLGRRESRDGWSFSYLHLLYLEVTNLCQAVLCS